MKMYAMDLEEGIRIIEPMLPVDCSVHECSVAPDIVEQSVLQERSVKGDTILVAYFQRNPVAYLFAATTDTWVDEIDDWFHIAPYEVYLYDAHTLPEYRGRRIYPFLMYSAADYFRRKTFHHAMIFSTARNVGSVKGIERCGFKCYEFVKYRNLLGCKCWQYKIGERHVESRLGNEN
jgi:GNAT superfamily N-acetyltransferase